MTKEVPQLFLVDDDPEVLELLAMVLEPDNHIALVASAVGTALRLIPDQVIELGIDVAIIDGGLLDGRGEEVATALRECIKAGTLPAIGIIGYSLDKVSFGDKNLKKGRPTTELKNAIASLILQK
jgi:DNA-binding response OmpR family regulator